MEKLSFDYDGRSNESVAHYRGLKIRAVQDETAGNPWEEWDGQPPLLWTSGEGWNDCGQGFCVESVLGSTRFFSDRQLALKWPELCRAVELDPAATEAELKAERKEYGGRLADYRRDKLESALSDMKPEGRSWSAACDYLAALETLWRLAGVPALDFQRSGYSQGDVVRGLLVALPEWQKKLGASYTDSAQLESDANLFGAWAFGDVFGFIIEDSEGETLDSCFGYYGTDFQESGLADAAKESADSILASAAKRRGEKLKELIRNRVPVALRPSILAEAGALGHVC